MQISVTTYLVESLPVLSVVVVMGFNISHDVIHPVTMGDVAESTGSDPIRYVVTDIRNRADYHRWAYLASMLHSLQSSVPDRR